MRCRNLIETLQVLTIIQLVFLFAERGPNSHFHNRSQEFVSLWHCNEFYKRKENRKLEKERTFSCWYCCILFFVFFLLFSSLIFLYLDYAYLIFLSPFRYRSNSRQSLHSKASLILFPHLVLRITSQSSLLALSLEIPWNLH